MTEEDGRRLKWEHDYEAAYTTFRLLIPTKMLRLHLDARVGLIKSCGRPFNAPVFQLKEPGKILGSFCQTSDMAGLEA
jgi:hypothetical protein